MTDTKSLTGPHVFTGNAGESLVVGELLRRGVIAALTPRNTPHWDVLATNGETSASIRVKTRSHRASTWVCRVAKNSEFDKQPWRRTVFPNQMEHDFVALVDLGNPAAVDPREPVRYWIIPTDLLEKWLQDRFKRYVRTPGKNGRKHNPDNWERRFGSDPTDHEWLSNYREQWELIINSIK